MNGIEKITERIVNDISAEISVIEAEAKAKCDEISAASDKAAQDEYWKLFKQGTNEAELKLDRLNRVAALEAKKRVLAEKQSLISQAFDRAVTMLSELPADEYIALLSNLAAKSARTGKEEIVLPSTDKEKFGTEICEQANSLLASRGIAGALSVAADTVNIRGGLILRDGKIEINCSLDSLVSSLKNELTAEVAEILFD